MLLQRLLLLLETQSSPQPLCFRGVRGTVAAAAAAAAAGSRDVALSWGFALLLLLLQQQVLPLVASSSRDSKVALSILVAAIVVYRHPAVSVHLRHAQDTENCFAPPVQQQQLQQLQQQQQQQQQQR